MKLQFEKNDIGEVSVKMQNGTFMSDFDYVNFIKGLIETNEIESEYKGLDEQEQSKLEELLENLKKAVEEGKRVLLDS